ncbi:MAG TPA: 4Fe-4S dicluster domain-containing protein [Planctomycetota bacterium]|nr:4Fe-4S dicluster domain-containing protein [Planctomycetota bacterium]
MIDPSMDFFLDPARCIGCKACMAACAECGTHRGESMIQVEYVDRGESPRTSPVVCLHCEEPACAAACPADAIKKTADGVVQSALQSRCVGCSNCVLACPFGVPKYLPKIDQMMKCDMCYDRTSRGKRPMCVTVCPSGALAFGPRERIEAARRETPFDRLGVAGRVVRTKVKLMAPAGAAEVEMDAAAFMEVEA